MAENKTKSPWDEMRTVRLDRVKGLNAVQTTLVSVNGRDFYVPCGKTVEVPLPIYNALERSRRAKDRYEINCQELSEAANSKELK